MADTVITTIIPTFRRPRLLKRAIESVLAQSFKNFKICVYDNASGDETEDVVAEYIRHDDRVFYFKNSQNIGGVNNMIQGVYAVNTDFYSLLNDDDFLLPDFYENAMREFESHPQAGFVCAKIITVDLVNKKMQFRSKDWLPGVYQPSNKIASKMSTSHLGQPGMLLRRSMRQLIGPFDKSGNDVLYMTMAAASSPFVVLDGYGAVFTIHPQSYTAMTGLRGTDIFTLYEALLFAVDSIMKINLPAERKVHLLMLATNAYCSIFDFKQQNQLMTGKYEGKKLGGMSLPSRITISGLIVKMYEVLPEKLHPVMTFCINLMLRTRKNRSKKIEANWSVLPEDANNFFLSLDTDVSKFLSCVQKSNMQSSETRGF
ncbi:MAG: GalNAc(5)-diNAcBac-PP-undecaprenol beta-1,3-glucosyltransferase [Syntrophomonadaceae bacterium]|nr:GalNAc(5)-diNAcBac-PP-undecaprenol beta-1,3-glucosyltransferase [Bacillota bacterium]